MIKERWLSKKQAKNISGYHINMSLNMSTTLNFGQNIEMFDEN